MICYIREMKICDIEIFKPSALSSVVVCYTVVFSYSLCQALRQYSGDVLNEQSENKTRDLGKGAVAVGKRLARFLIFDPLFTFTMHYLGAWNRLFLVAALRDDTKNGCEQTTSVVEMFY